MPSDKVLEMLSPSSESGIYLDGDRHTFDVYPGLLNHHNSDYDQHWDPDYPSQYYVPWLIREGSGWDWFLRDR